VTSRLSKVKAPQASPDSPERLLHKEENCDLYRSYKLAGILKKYAAKFVLW
jgi:hypothetical protein